MPYRDPSAARLAARERQRRRRARLRAAKPAALLAAPGAVAAPSDPVGELARWAASTLRVPPGHPLAGQPMALPGFAEDFLRAGWGTHESALCVARKNAKSAICAVLALGYLVGPLRTSGWRGAIASVSKEKAGELRSQVEAIAQASALADVRIRRSPYPGRIESPTGTLETLSADRTAGHSSSFDLIVVDETGLMPERARELLAGLRSSVSAKGGRIVHISVRGDSPLLGEILSNPAVVSRIYAAAEGCALDDPAAWAAANPGLGTIKQASYMQAEVLRVAGAPGDEPSFRAFDLNQNLDPTREMICSPDDLRECFDADPPGRVGACYLGFDFGEATSSTAAAAIWPSTGLVETWQAFGDVPALVERQRRDSAPYVAMEARGELRTYPGRIVPLAAFLGDLQADLAGCRIEAAAADSYKDSEVKDFLDRAAVRWPIQFRRVGAGKDGGADVRAFQRLVHMRRLVMAGKPVAIERDCEVDNAARRERKPGARQGELARTD